MSEAREQETMGLSFKCPECRHTSHQTRAEGCEVICLNCKLVTPAILGQPILKQASAPGGNGTRHGRIVLVYTGQGPQPYCTAWNGREGEVYDRSWVWGHYFAQRPEAEEDFESRAKRGW